MTDPIPENSRLHPRITPLLMNNFSRLNRTADSGYDSSFLSTSSLTPSTDCDSSICSSTPIPILPHRIRKILTPFSNTPVGHRKFSSDRIPCRRTILCSHEEEEISADDILSNLIQRSASPVVQRILRYLNPEDLLSLCQVSDIYCQAVCSHQECLRRLSKFLITAHQNCENRASSSQHNRSSGRILREIQNVMSTEQPAVGSVPTVPSPLETIDLENIPSTLRSLLNMTKSLTELQCVVSCRTCRRFVAVRQSQKSHECVRCQRNTVARRAGKKLMNYRWKLLMENTGRYISAFPPVYIIKCFHDFIPAIIMRFQRFALGSAAAQLTHAPVSTCRVLSIAPLFFLLLISILFIF